VRGVGHLPGALISELAASYDYGSMHRAVRASPWLGFDAQMVPGYAALATVWGDFSAADLAMDQVGQHLTAACYCNF
jgi:hypothetical protein